MLGNKVSWREDGVQYRVRSDGKVEGTDPNEQKDWIDRFGLDAFRRFRGRSGNLHDRISLSDEEQM